MTKPIPPIRHLLPADRTIQHALIDHHAETMNKAIHALWDTVEAAGIPPGVCAVLMQRSIAAILVTMIRPEDRELAVNDLGDHFGHAIQAAELRFSPDECGGYCWLPDQQFQNPAGSA